MLLSRIGAGRINSILKMKHVGLITEETLKYCKISLTSNFAICNLLLSLLTLLSTRFGLKQNTISKLWNKHWTQNIVCRHCNAINRELFLFPQGSFLNKNVTAIASKTMLRSSSQKTGKSYVFQAVEDQAPSQAKNKKVRDSFFI